MPSDLVPTARELLEALGSNTWTDGRADRLIETLGQAMGRATPAESREALAMLSSGLNSLEPEPAGVASRIGRAGRYAKPREHEHRHDQPGGDERADHQEHSPQRRSNPSHARSMRAPPGRRKPPAAAS